jgi:hypothetical protein
VLGFLILKISTKKELQQSLKLLLPTLWLDDSHSTIYFITLDESLNLVPFKCLLGFYNDLIEVSKFLA